MSMPVVILFKVAGEPAGQPRMRHSAFMSKGRLIQRNYTPDTADGWKDLIYLAALRHKPREPHLHAVRVDTVFYFARPQRLLTRSAPEHVLPHLAKPDKDNCEKAVLDVLKSVGFYRDDAQVYDGRPTKYYAAKGASPGAEITITLYPEGMAL